MSSKHLDTLEILLGQCKESALFELARSFKIRGYSLQSKADLIRSMSGQILERARVILPILGKEELIVLGQAMETRCVNLDEKHQFIGLLVSEFGWGLTKTDNNEDTICLARELRELYIQLSEEEAFWKRQEQMQKLRVYRNALLNLYGIVEITWLKQLYQRDVPLNMNMRSFIEVIEAMNKLYTGCQLNSYYLVHESLYCIEQEEFASFKELISGYDYYEPPADEIVALENEFYYEECLETKRVREFLKNHCNLDQQMAEFAVAVLNVHMRIQEDVKMVNMLQVVDEWHRLGIYVGGIKQLEGIVPLVLQMMEVTRMWRLKGYMPSELGIKLAPVIARGGRVTQEKRDIGRNELCPCGSGKKYKKCCLNKIGDDE